MPKINKLHFNGADYDIGDKDIHDMTAKSTLADNDEFMIADSADSYGQKKVTLENMMNTAIGNMYSESTCADGDLTISAGNVDCRADHYFMCAKEWNFNNFTVCPGITVLFCGNDEPVIKVGGIFCNEGIIDTYGPKTEDCINIMNGSLYAKGVKDRPAFECCGGKGGCCTAVLFSGNGGGMGESGGIGCCCSGGTTYTGGAGTTYAGGGGASSGTNGCAANDTCGGRGGTTIGAYGGGGGFGLTKGGDGGYGSLQGGNGGNSLYGKGGSGGCGFCTRACAGDGGNSLYGDGGRGGVTSCNCSYGGKGGCGRNGGDGGVTSCNCSYGGKGGDAYNRHFGLTVIANDFYNCCINAGGGNGGSGGNSGVANGLGGDGGSGGNGGNVTILYHNLCNRGDINVKGGSGGKGGMITASNYCSSCFVSNMGQPGKDGADGRLIIGQI